MEGTQPATLPPMAACVHFRLPDGSLVSLSPGDLIGRHWTAAAWIADPRLSEAHAMVSLRGPTLKLLALRGRFSLGGELLSELDLEAGQRIRLATDLELVVMESPRFVLALDGPGLPEQVLTGVASLTGGPRPRLRRGVKPDADVVVFSDGERWLVQRGAQQRELRLPETLMVGDQAFRLRAVPLDQHSSDATQQQGRVDAPLRIEIRLDTVHISRGDALLVRLVGTPARLMTEVALMQAPAAWEVVAGEVWPKVRARHVLRNRWDNGMSRLRRTLRQARLLGGGQLLSVGSRVQVWQLPTSLLPRPLRSEYGLADLVVSRDQRTLIGATGGGTLVRWRPDEDNTPEEVRVSTGVVKSVALDPKGDRLLVAAAAALGLFWTQFGEPLRQTPLVPRMIARRVATLADGHAVATTRACLVPMGRSNPSTFRSTRCSWI